MRQYPSRNNINSKTNNNTKKSISAKREKTIDTVKYNKLVAQVLYEMLDDRVARRVSVYEHLVCVDSGTVLPILHR